MRALADQLSPRPRRAAPTPPPAIGAAQNGAIVRARRPAAAGGEVTITVPGRDHRPARRHNGAAPRRPPRARGDLDRPRLRATAGATTRASSPQPLPLPRARPALAALASGELRYHHFSVVMHRARALALFTAVNIDGKLAREPKRERDRWILDPRLPAEQTGEAVYRDNPLDRGHLVRRLDPAWGTEASRQGRERRHVPLHQLRAAAPQFNAGSTLWAGWRTTSSSNADSATAVSVFTGPVLADDDDPYRGVQLPRQFWKVVGMVTHDGGCRSPATCSARPRCSTSSEPTRRSPTARTGRSRCRCGGSRS